MRIQFELDYGSVFDLLGEPGMIHCGQVFSGPEGIELVCDNVMEKRAADASVLVDFVVTATGTVAGGIVANWLWGKLGCRARRVSIDRIEIESSESGFKKVVIEKLKFEE
ncbi:MAG: hypothetical protein KJ650_10700 [Firmicutes bacterium]|nr:hypothetical protein [Bacillota bacterium]MBV1727031.1 hypothetical protein [Desulforudis sp.]MBV1734535.1 hypothetical protein [Desulforudis sp.]